MVRVVEIIKVGGMLQSNSLIQVVLNRWYCDCGLYLNVRCYTYYVLSGNAQCGEFSPLYLYSTVVPSTVQVGPWVHDPGRKTNFEFQMVVGSFMGSCAKLPLAVQNDFNVLRQEFPIPGNCPGLRMLVHIKLSGSFVCQQMVGAICGH